MTDFGFFSDQGEDYVGLEEGEEGGAEGSGVLNL